MKKQSKNIFKNQKSLLTPKILNVILNGKFLKEKTYFKIKTPKIFKRKKIKK